MDLSGRIGKDPVLFGVFWQKEASVEILNEGDCWELVQILPLWTFFHVFKTGTFFFLSFTLASAMMQVFRYSQTALHTELFLTAAKHAVITRF